MLPLMQAADVMILTLETVATTADIHWPNKRFLPGTAAGWRGSPSYRESSRLQTRFSLRGVFTLMRLWCADKMSTANVETLKIAGVDYVALATNHAIDFDVDGVVETQSTLDRLGIRHAGVGRNRRLAFEPATISRGGVDLRLFSFGD